MKSRVKPSSIFVTTLLSSFFVLALSSSIFAHKDSIKENYKDTNKEELLQQLKKYNVEEDGFVEAYVIQGDGIIQIMKDTNIGIRIRHSIIKGGLDFTGKLQNVPISNAIISKSWNQKTWDEFIERRCMYRTVHEDFGTHHITIVKNRIVIEDSEIQSSINAENTLFYQGILFKDVTFDGKINFEKAIFSGKVVITDATFGQIVEFDGTFFRDA